MMNDVIDRIRIWLKDWKRGYSDSDIISALVKKHSDDGSAVSVLSKKEWKAFHTKHFERLCFVIKEASEGRGTLINLEDSFLYSAFKDALLREPMRRECKKDKEFYGGSQWDDTPNSAVIKRPYDFNRINDRIGDISSDSVKDILDGKDKS